MSRATQQKLASLYKGRDIKDLWNLSKDAPVIEHPTRGKISPNQLRAEFANTPCPLCQHTMVQGKEQFITKSKQEAIERGYQYKTASGKKTINHVKISKCRCIYFHPHYVTLDHKLNKARLPELMFEYDNLQAICWKCNMAKSDDNAYKIKQNMNRIRLSSQSLQERFQTL